MKLVLLRLYSSRSGSTQTCSVAGPAFPPGTEASLLLCFMFHPKAKTRFGELAFSVKLSQDNTVHNSPHCSPLVDLALPPSIIYSIFLPWHPFYSHQFDLYSSFWSLFVLLCNLSLCSLNCPFCYFHYLMLYFKFLRGISVLPVLSHFFKYTLDLSAILCIGNILEICIK